MPKSSAVRWIASLAIALPALASAQQAFTNSAVNLRAGPDADYPRVRWLPEGTPVEVQGCIADYRWCDVIVYDDRGWINANYLSYPYQNGYAPLITFGPVIGVPLIGFSIFSYWDDHYRRRPWYDNRRRWEGRPYPPPPPPGYRPPAWRPPPPDWRPPGRPDWRPDRPDWRPDRPSYRPDGRPGRPDYRPPQARPPEFRPPEPRPPQFRPPEPRPPQSPPGIRPPQVQPPQVQPPQARPPQGRPPQMQPAPIARPAPPAPGGGRPPSGRPPGDRSNTPPGGMTTGVF